MNEWPSIPEDLLLYLERQFPPRCLGPLENVESHRHYAGEVGLVQKMRAAFLQQRSRGRPATEVEISHEPSERPF